MTMQGYVDDVLMASGVVANAAIIAHDGTVLATSQDFEVKSEEAQNFLNYFTNIDETATNGVVVNETKYVALTNDERSIYAKKGTSGVILVRTNQNIILGMWDGNMNVTLQNVAKTVEALADTLITQSL